MKKQLAMALATSVVMSAAGTVFAAEDPYDFKFSGSLNTQFRSDDKTNYSNGDENVNATGLKTTLTINMDKALTDNLSLYSRFTHQSFNNNGAKDQADWIKEDYNTAIDAFGLKYNNAGVNYTVGSQALTLGATGLVYDNGFIGRHALPYALKIEGKAGATNLTAGYAKTNYQDGVDNDKFYYLQGQYAVSDKANVGAFFAHAAYGNDTKTNLIVNNEDSLNYYGISASYKITDKLNFVTEFIKSNADKDDKGYIGGFTYALDNKNTFGASYYRVEDQAAIVDANLHSMTTAPFSNAKGYILSYNYKLNNNTTVAASYDTQDRINDGLAGAINDRNRTRVGVTFSF